MAAFTQQDLDVLMEALGDWEAKPEIACATAQLIVSPLMGKLPPDMAEELKTKQTNEAAAEGKQRKERVIRLKAKLLEMRDSMEADRLLNASQRKD